MVTSFSKYSSVGDIVGYIFVVADGDGKGIVVSKTTYPTSKTCIPGFMVVILCNY